MVGYEEQLLVRGGGGGGGGGVFSVSHPDPLVLELNRLQNLLKEKEREMAASQAEIKALRVTDALKDKAIEELRKEASKLSEKLRFTENLVEQKNLDIKKVTKQKKDAFVAQYAAEATLRRLHANLKDDDSPPIESFLAPLEAEIKMHKSKIAALQEDKKAMERITKSKESALLEAERILQSALERALIVEEVQNENFDLKRQIEICQEENRILEKTNRQRVLEVEKLSQTIQDLEETILAGGATANTIRDCRRQISELNEEKKMLERELARAKVSANRVATVVANEWKDENDKVMPVRQWLEERRLLQAEILRLKDRLAVSDRTAKAEAQLKDKLKLRLKTLEEGLKHVSSFSTSSDTFCRSPKQEKGNVLGFLTSNGRMRKRSASQPRASKVSRNYPLQQPNVETEIIYAPGQLRQSDGFKKTDSFGENMLRKSLWAFKSKVVDNSGKENAVVLGNTDGNSDKQKHDPAISAETKIKDGSNEQLLQKDSTNTNVEDVVSGFLYDTIQKEVINLRKSCEVKDSRLNAKEQEIQMLMKKVDALTKTVEVELRKVKIEAAAREKQSLRSELEKTKKAGITSLPKRITNLS